ncbi:fasciclin domain-containing protein [Mesonia mobilis]|uniref:FAS1 domain-containing protein n=1 Tax=Mesonia mobilis TaxID=369791 RepID=A0ABQ3BVV8_9FLAO|nr:fasciclin domain-containing protein [Mesonia mobilis]MBQ0738011.1 fasciclin domain-containing protein [Aquimarina celericrescens]GGZ59192.1 hypothetical protein GCM10008088_21030 [Mesonia mobilis]
MRTLNYLSKLSLVAFLFLGLNAFAQDSSKTLTANISSASDLSEFYGLLETTKTVNLLNDGNSYTIFAPVNDAFESLIQEKYVNMPSGENKLRAITTYHILEGSWTLEKIQNKIKEKGGRTMVKTVEGTPLTFSDNEEGNLIVVDHLGRANVVISSENQSSNGLIYKTKSILLPAR